MSGLRAIMRTTAARLSALYLLLFTVGAVLLVLYMTSLSVSAFISQTRETINEEIAGLQTAYRHGGFPLLFRVVQRRSHQPGANLYLIADSAGRIFAGNVDSIAPGVLSEDGWTSQPFEYSRFGENQRDARSVDNLPAVSETRNHRAIARVMHMSNGMIVLVGRDLGEPERFRSVVRRALGLALGIMAVGGFLIWFFVGRRALRRIDAVSAASRKIMTGDLSGRLPVSGAGDEFDRLAVNLNSMLERIGELNSGLKQVSDNIAHDLKTPLTRMRNRIEASLAGQKKPAQLRKTLEENLADSDHLIRTFNAILMISRLEAGQSADLSNSVPLAPIIDDVAELYDPVAEEAHLTIRKDIERDYAVKGNRELIAQSLSNIIDNAIKYASDESGTQNSIDVGLHRRAGWICLSVRDYGPGIDDPDKQRVVERFVRLEESRTKSGSGLGLSLAKAVMKLHDGELRLSDGNPGLVVELRFPEPEKTA